ncbi:unnamed protein product [Danaus chrysippus]|uniref:(African queen) hypothetical protein n=1 Tax=Danaus chrysippus TaxID=151541 RepID=A0A8J2QJX6_9NEOP|nr:unnamed protein product [Danaus chrysippus]
MCGPQRWFTNRRLANYTCDRSVAINTLIVTLPSSHREGLPKKAIGPPFADPGRKSRLREDDCTPFATSHTVATLRQILLYSEYTNRY